MVMTMMTDSLNGLYAMHAHRKSSPNNAPVKVQPHYPPVQANMRGHLTTIEVKSCPGGRDIEMYSIEGCGLPGLNTHVYYGCLWKLAETETRILSVEHEWKFFCLSVL